MTQTDPKICLSHRGVTRFKSNQIKSKCCVPRFETQPTHNTRKSRSSVMTQTNPKICLSQKGVTRFKSNQIKPAQIKSNQIGSNQNVVFLGLKHNQLGTHTPDICLGNDSEKSKICPSHWGETRLHKQNYNTFKLNSNFNY
jgi:hypothetical protein